MMSESGTTASAAGQPARTGGRARWRTPVNVFLVCTALGLLFGTSSAGFANGFMQWYIWGALVWPIVWVDRRLPVRHDQLFLRALWHLPLGVAWTIVYLYLQRKIGGLMVGAGFHFWVRRETLQMWLAGGIHWNIVVYWMIIAGHLAHEHNQRWLERQQRAAELERLLAEARLGALRAQLRPHFLFNSLNAISAYVEHEPRVARRMLGHLGDLLRWSLEDAESQEVPLANELALLNHYLAIQRIRFADRLTVDLDIDPSTLWARVPGLLLQPLVENAIRHGIAPRNAPGHIIVRARRDAASGQLRITVEDDGVGLPTHVNGNGNENGRTGIGLDNTRRRLTALYGDEQSFSVRSVPPPSTGVHVEVAIPLRESERKEASA